MFTSYNTSTPSYFHNSQGLVYNPRKNSSCSSSLEDFSTESPFSHESDKNFEKFLNLDENQAESPKRECMELMNEKIESNQMTPLKLPPATTFDVNSLPPQQLAMLHQQGIFPPFGVDLRYFGGFRLPFSTSQSTTSHMPTVTTSPARFIDIRPTACPEMTDRNYKKILEKSKRIMKREKAKNRSLLKQTSRNSSEGSTATSVTVTPPSKPLLPEIIEEEPVVNADKALSSLAGGPQNEAVSKKQREMMQKIRNRISAQQSRDRRKEYIQNLERENQTLRLDNQRLKEKLQKQLQKQQSKKVKLEPEGPEKSVFNEIEGTGSMGGRDNMILLALFTLFSLVLFLNYSQKTIFGKTNAVTTDGSVTGGEMFMDRPLSIGNSNSIEIEDCAGLKSKAEEEKRKGKESSSAGIHSTNGKIETKALIKRRGRHKKNDDSRKQPTEKTVLAEF